MRGFTRYAKEAVEGTGNVSPESQKFLAGEFNGARERMTTLATTVGTAGSFVLVLVALLVGFAKGANDESTKLVAATQAAALAAQNCSDKSPSQACNETKLNQALESVRVAQDRVNDLGRLNKLQAVAAGFVLLGFALGLAGVLTNPVPGPDARQNEKDANPPVVGTKAAWREATERLGLKKKWIMAALAVQACSAAAIVAIGADVFA